MENKISLEDLRNTIRDVYNFPKEGIVFKDITSALVKPLLVKFIVDSLYEKYKDKGITKVLGIESRGFIIGGALAYKLNAGFVPIRKPGKLPYDKISQSYALEYGEDSLEMHVDAVNEKDRVLVHDDLLATGGTALACVELLKKLGVETCELSFILDLSFLGGEDRIKKECDAKIFSLLTY